MAKVKLLIGFARTDEPWNKGDIVNVSGSEAEDMVAAGYAELVESKQEKVEIPEQKANKRRITKRVKK